METDLGDLEESKENVLPLKRGRKIATLQAALDESGKDRLTQLKQQFETDLRLYTGDDELEIWYPYILWVEQNFPKGGQDGNLALLLKQCVNRFLSKPEYKDDERYIDCWLKYVRYIPNTFEAFLLMDSHEIGHKSAAFYEAWSWHLEQLGNLRKANSVLQEGIDNNAQPLKILLDSQKQLSRKFVQQYTSNNHREENNDTRAALEGLRPIGKRNLAPVSRVGNARLEGQSTHLVNHNVVLPPSQNGRIQVLQDAENIPSVKPKVPLLSAPSDAWVSENQLKRRPWNTVKLKSASSKMTPVMQKPDFKVHVDNNQPNMGTGRKLSSAFTTVLRGSQVETKFGFIEPDDPQKLYVCDIQKLYGGADEFQPEEIAAARWFQNQKNKQEKERVSKLEEEVQKLKCLTASINENHMKQNSLASQHFEAAGVETRSIDSTGLISSGKSTPRSEISSPTRDVIALWNATLSIPAKDNVSNSATTDSDSKSVPNSELKKPNFQVQVYSDEQEVNMAGKNTPAQIYIDDQENAAPKKPVFQVYDEGNAKLEKQPFQIFQDKKGKPDLKKPAFQVYTDNLENDQENAAPKKPVFQVYDEENAKSGKQQFQVFQDKREEVDLKKTAFQIYTDNQENDQDNLPPSINPDMRALDENDEFKENMAPCGFVPNVKKQASPHNILQITDRLIPFGDDEDDIDEDLGVHPLTDDTIAPLTDNLGFYQNPKFSSTPCITNRISKPSEDFVQPMQITKQSVSQFKTPCNTEKLPLSPITEASREISKTSSTCTTSSSSSASSLAQSTRRITQSAKSLICPGTSFMSPVDPFDPELISSFLSSANLSCRAGYIKVECEMSRLHKQKCLVFGHHRLHIVSQLAEGGEGIIYKAETEDDAELPRELVVKVYKPTNLWEFYIHSELKIRICNVQQKVDIGDSLPSIFLSPVYRSSNLLITEYCPLGTLVDLVNSFWKKKENVPESLTLYLTWEILQIVKQLHACQLIHGDIKPDNFMVLTLPTDINILDFSKTSCIRLIDYGQSIDLTMFPKGTTFNGSIKTQNFVCPEMLENKPWVYQADYFGILGTIHTLLFHDYMEIVKVNERWEMRNKFKRYWQIQFWNKLFDTLLNVPDCEHMPDLSAFTEELENIMKMIKPLKGNLINTGTKQFAVLKSGKCLKR